MWTMRAIGSTPRAFRPRSLTIITPAAPSQIWLEVAAVSTPFSSSSFTAAMPSRVPSKRMPSSTRCISLVPSGSVISMGRISAVKAPLLVAAMAFWWLAKP